MKLTYALLSLALFIGSASTASAQTLWRETTAGMSPSEVAALVPDAVPPEGKGSSLNSGAVELLKVEAFELMNETFSASFYFKDMKLSQVTLSLKTKTSFPSAVRLFDSLSEALRSKYGRELSRKVTNTPFASAEATWMSGSTNIDLITFSVAPGHLVFNINYQVRLAREASKL